VYNQKHDNHILFLSTIFAFIGFRKKFKIKFCPLRFFYIVNIWRQPNILIIYFSIHKCVTLKEIFQIEYANKKRRQLHCLATNKTIKKKLDQYYKNDKPRINQSNNNIIDSQASMVCLLSSPGKNPLSLFLRLTINTISHLFLLVVLLWEKSM
jgi:hypothetical protein